MDSGPLCCLFSLLGWSKQSVTSSVCCLSDVFGENKATWNKVWSAICQDIVTVNDELDSVSCLFTWLGYCSVCHFKLSEDLSCNKVIWTKVQSAVCQNFIDVSGAVWTEAQYAACLSCSVSVKHGLEDPVFCSSAFVGCSQTGWSKVQSAVCQALVAMSRLT